MKKRLLAIILALAMVMQVGGGVNLASAEGTTERVAIPSGDETSATIEGNIDVKDQREALQVTANGESDIEATINGNVTLTNDEDFDYYIMRGVNVEASDDNTVKVTIEGNVKSTYESDNDENGYISNTGIRVYARDDSSVEVVADDIVVEGKSVTGISAYTDYPTIYTDENDKVIVMEKDASSEITVDNITATGTGSAVGITVSKGDNTITVNDKVTVTGETYVTGVNVYNDNYSYTDEDNQIKVEIGKELEDAKQDALVVTSKGEDGDVTAISVNGNANVDLSIDGSVKATADNASGAYVRHSGSYGYGDGETKVDTSESVVVKGDLVVDGKDQASGIYTNAYENGSISVEIDGKVTTTSDGGTVVRQSWYGEYDENGRMIFVDEEYLPTDAGIQIRVSSDSDVSSVIGEGVVVTSKENNVVGIMANTYDEDSTASVIAKDGGVTVKSDKGEVVYGIQADENVGTINIAVTGDVTVDGAGKNADVAAIQANSNVGTISIDVKGDVTSNGAGINVENQLWNQFTWVELPDDFEPDEKDAIIVDDEETGYKLYYNAEKDIYYNTYGEMRTQRQENEPSTSITVDGNLSVSGDKSAIYINDGGTENITAKWEDYEGEINEDELIYTNVFEDEDGKKVTYKTYYNKEGNFYYDSEGNKITPEYYFESIGKTKVEVKGDVEGGFAGAWIDAASEKATVDLIVDGTISGDEHSIVLSNETTSEGLTITVWQVNPDEDGNLISRVAGYDNTAEDDGTIYAQDREAEKEIQYIIRIAQPDIITTEGTTDYEGYKVAKEGDTVYVKLNIPAGYSLNQVWQNEDQSVSVIQDANGNYYLAVPWGGGVSLSVTLTKIATGGSGNEKKAATGGVHYAVGRTVEFGHYDFDGDETKEALTWKILSVVNGVAKIAMETGIEAIPDDFDTAFDETETAALRSNVTELDSASVKKYFNDDLVHPTVEVVFKALGI